jgi:hypothetical protein
MPKGGARARSGPAPDPNALRRERDEGEWTVLPAEGREGDPPAWPLLGQSEREVELWERLWRLPQAVVWQRLQQQIEVALHVRNLALAELIEAPVALRTLVRQQADSLGLTTPGMRANRWKVDRAVASPERHAAPPAGGAPRKRTQSARERWKVIDGGAAS